MTELKHGIELSGVNSMANCCTVSCIVVNQLLVLAPTALCAGASNELARLPMLVLSQLPFVPNLKSLESWQG